jgi:hypothetical protein
MQRDEDSRRINFIIPQSYPVPSAWSLGLHKPGNEAIWRPYVIEVRPVTLNLMPKIDLKTIIRHQFQSWKRNWSSTKTLIKQLDPTKESFRDQSTRLFFFVLDLPQERDSKSTKYTINQGMKSHTANLASIVTYFSTVVTYFSPISESLSRQKNHLLSIPYCTTFTKYSTSKQLPDLGLISERREASNHLFGTVETPQRNVCG